MTGLTFAAAAIALVPLIAVISYVLIQGVSQLNFNAFTQLTPPPGVPGGGFANAILGTLLMVGLGACLAVPVGVMAAVFLSEFGGGTSLASWIRFATNVLSGVPSIVVGVFAYGVVVLTTGGFSAIAGGFALAILMLPIIARTTEESLKLIPNEVRQAAVGLGATNMQTVFWVVLPAALPAILTGVMLAISRAAGETAPLIFTALFTQFWPRSILEPTPSLSVLIYNFATVPFKNQQALAWSASLVLIVLVLFTSVISRWATHRKTY
ncbi:phosphate ABC transporter permease [Neosynechococcus sphagnicola sy1]|uniref:Phosphate transport system permease protein PstA n=1 Tax=Neosynechococcus sphagnicola sy1 TaxID=1497020 RepID=A0A098TL47_9CYAN|nr:phosphate ABC transporter permease PstA [Neosynechococcus sphagnicola]KGF73019.1 phosphate ABC transporter permease [Neosynechococcus sphagnicola sy1]